MIKGVIFDLYGTLIDAHNLFLPIAEIIAKEKNINPWEVKKLIDKKYWEIFKDYHLKEFKPERYYYNILFNQLKESLNLTYDAQWYIDRMYNTFTNLKVYEDVWILKELKKKNIKISILSNADNDFVFPTLEKLKDKIVFDDFLTSDSARCYKPDPKIFNLILNKLNLKKENTIFVGDSYSADYIGGKNAGIRTFLLDRYNKYDGIPDRIDSLEKILDIIEEENSE